MRRREEPAVARTPTLGELESEDSPCFAPVRMRHSLDPARQCRPYPSVPPHILTLAFARLRNKTPAGAGLRLYSVAKQSAAQRTRPVLRNAAITNQVGIHLSAD